MLNYKLSDGAKFNALWSLLNVNYNEAGEWRVDYDICEVYDDYAVVKNYDEGIWERVYYTKNDETDSVEITERVRCYIMDVSENEKQALETLHKLNGDTYEKVDENYSANKEEAGKVEGLNNQISELQAQTETYTAEKENFESKIEELNTSISTLTTERDEFSAQYTEAKASVENLTAENASLSSFKADVEKKEKEQIIDKYSVKLSKEVLDSYTENLDNYTVDSLDRELAYALVNSDTSIFSVEPEKTLLPKGQPAMSGIEEILTKYAK